MSPPPSPLSVIEATIRNSRAIVSVVDMFRRRDERAIVRAAEAIYDFDLQPATPLTLSARGRLESLRRFGSPCWLTEEQEIIAIRDRHRGTEALYNALTYPLPRCPEASVRRPSAAGAGCRWCERKGDHEAGLWTDLHGELAQHGNRVVAHADVERAAPVCGVVFGDERMHDLAEMPEADFAALCTAAEAYAARALDHDPGLFLAYDFMADDPRCSHARIRVLGRTGRHFAFPESVAAAAPRDYWECSMEVHRGLGLTLGTGAVAASVSLAPAGHAEVFLHSPTLADGANAVHRLLGNPVLRSKGFSLAAYPAPRQRADTLTPRFSRWPPVLWRLVVTDDSAGALPPRRDLETVRIDPFTFTESLRGNIGW